MDLTDIRNLTIKAQVNAMVAEQKLSGIDATLDATNNNTIRIPALTRSGQEVTCSVVSRQIHETRDIVHKLQNDMENLRDQLREILAEVDSINRVTTLIKEAKS